MGTPLRSGCLYAAVKEHLQTGTDCLGMADGVLSLQRANKAISAANAAGNRYQAALKMLSDLILRGKVPPEFDSSLDD